MYILIGVVVLFILVIGGILLVSNFSSVNANSQESQNPETQEEVTMGCEMNEDCDDNDKCTIESCTGKVCIITDVLLCYNNDGCCPNNCNSANDNDCLSVKEE